MRHHGPISSVASHGAYVATAGYDNQIILWDGARRKALARVCHDHLLNHCAFSHDGKYLVSASSDYSARVWEIPSLRLITVLAEHGDDVDMAEFSPDDTQIATCALDRCVRVFDRAGRCLRVFRGHTGNIISLVWSGDGRRVVSSSVDGTIREWDVSGDAEPVVSDLGVRTDSVVMNEEGHLYAGDDRGRIAVIIGGATRYVQAHRAGIKKIALDGKQRVLVSLSYDHSIAFWRIGEDDLPVEIKRAPCPPPIWARAAAVMEDGRIATGSFGGCYALFDWRTGVWDLEGVHAENAINAVMALPGRVYTVGDAGIVRLNGQTHAEMGSLCNFLVSIGDLVLTGGQLGQVFDASTGHVLHQHHSPLNCGVFFMRGGAPHVAIGAYTGEILIFTLDKAGGLSLVESLSVYENAVKGLAVDDPLNSAVLFSTCASMKIAWHSLDDFSMLHRVDKAHERIANGCCRAGVGVFATISRDRTLKLWRQDGQSETFMSLHPLSPLAIISVLDGQSETFMSLHPNSIKCIAVNPDLTMLMTGSYGGTVAPFDLRTRQWGEMTRPTASGISSMTYDADQNRFLAASYDGHLYPVAL